MEQIIVNKGTKTDNQKKNVLQEVTSGEFFEKFIDYIRRSESNPKGLSNAAIATFREHGHDGLFQRIHKEDESIGWSKS